MTDVPQPPPDEAVAEQVHAPIEVFLELDDDQWALVMRRRFPSRPETLWEMLTDPAKLARWSPIVADRPMTEPGSADCRENPGDEPVDAEVLIATAPRRLVHRWGADLLYWTLTPDRDGTVLELRQTTGAREAASMLAAGWQVCLARLAAEDGTNRERPTGQRAMVYGWQQLHNHHQARFAAESPQREEKEPQFESMLRGVFLTSDTPETTAHWYRKIARVPLEAAGDSDYTYWRLDVGGMQIAVHDAAAFASYADPPNAGSNLTHLYFTIQDRDDFLAHLDRLGISPFNTDDVVVTVIDPDGRKVMFGTS